MQVSYAGKVSKDKAKICKKSEDLGKELWKKCSKELGHKVCKKSSQELVQKECKNSSKVLCIQYASIVASKHKRMYARKIARNQAKITQEHLHGTRQKDMEDKQQILGKNVCKKSSKKLGKKICSKSSKGLGKNI